MPGQRRVGQEYNLEGKGRVESSSRLVQKDDARIGNKLNSDGSALPLAATNPLDKRIPHLQFRAARQAQIQNQIVHDFVLFLFGQIHADVACELKVFAGSES